MEMLEDHISHREARYNSNKHHRRDTKNPSFSSSLLDSIYRSIDEAENHRERDLIFYKQTVTKKKHNTTINASMISSHGVNAEEETIVSLKRACLVEKWMEIKKAEKVDNVAARRNSTADFERSYLKYSSSTSSEGSSHGGGFFSSEADSRSMSTSSSCYTMKTTSTKSNRTEDHTRPKPIKTRQDHKPNKQENQFVKKKTKALKIYMDLKKAKQPISPGGKLGSFLTSIFNNGKKKHEVNVIDVELATKSTNYGSNCSSVSSFTKSCLRKSSVSRGDIGNGDGESGKRSVRFYLVDEDCRPCGHKTREDDHHRRQVEEIARSYLMKNCQKKTSYVEEMEEDDDDAASYASSDLFELDTIGVEEKYYKELPVYETTYFG